MTKPCISELNRYYKVVKYTWYLVVFDSTYVVEYNVCNSKQSRNPTFCCPS